ncbi:MAG: Phosphoesterase, dhha1 [Parcubacteria group bacterium GW2011_GWC1_43_11]|nr:MAG: Phosphoesterase, dhha1 [Parcubacteria group bacterium GW2011_GWC1_43_11]
MKNIVILYHSSCPDGFSAAWAAWKKFGKEATYVPVDRRPILPKGLKGKIIYSLDFVHDEPMLSNLLKTAAKVVFIDHHITAKEKAKRGAECVFDLKRSGAVLAWQYFHPTKKIPRLLLHVEDFDLWKFKLPHTREVDILLELINFDFRTWDKMVREMENPYRRKVMFKEAAFLNRYKRRLIEGLVKSADLVSLAGRKTLAVNSPIFNSEIGHSLCRKLPPIGIVWRAKNEEIIVSLRSNGKMDVSKIAKHFGGGGHKASAGFSLPRNAKLPWKILKK